MRKILAAVLIAAAVNGLAVGQPSPTGRLETFIFAESKIFPGTTRNVSVYIPAQLDPQKPACVYVQHDGLNRTEGAPALLDSLIAQKIIPVTVGVFVRPGNLASYVEGSRPRLNRSLEYDGLGDDQARFILEELLPAVSAKYNLRLSDNANDRAIGGMSSGGIAAFNAAWERPDGFSRVYCNSGSFVAFRGGNVYPALVRKFEPLPIRFFLTVATEDMKNAGGDWTLSNYQMEEALKFSGYDFGFKVVEGRHVAGYEETFAEAMTFLWRGWPAKVAVGAGAPRVRDIILPGESWKKLSPGYTGMRSAVFNSAGEVFFCAQGRIVKIGSDGHVAGPRAFGKRPVTALAVGSDDALYTLDDRGRINVYDTTGRPAVFARRVHGDQMIARPAGGLYVADSRTGRISFVMKNRKPAGVSTGLKDPSAMALAPDHWQLAVSEKDDHRVFNFEISPEGALRNGERFFWLHRSDAGLGGGARDLQYDREGHLVAATAMGIQFSGDEGKVVAILPAPGSALQGICFGGRDLDLIYAFCADGVYVRKLRVHGTGAFTPQMRMRRTPL